MNIGRMDQRVTLRSPVSARSASGEAVNTWVDHKTVWAERLPQSGREWYAAMARNAEVTGIFRIRYRAQVNEKWMMVCGGVSYDIVAVLEVGRRNGMDLLVKTSPR